jgi:hypothetical protein
MYKTLTFRGTEFFHLFDVIRVLLIVGDDVVGSFTTGTVERCELTFSSSHKSIDNEKLTYNS